MFRPEYLSSSILQLVTFIPPSSIDISTNADQHEYQTPKPKERLLVHQQEAEGSLPHPASKSLSLFTGYSAPTKICWLWLSLAFLSSAPPASAIEWSEATGEDRQQELASLL
jgi:hypothetical protein